MKSGVRNIVPHCPHVAMMLTVGGNTPHASLSGMNFDKNMFVILRNDNSHAHVPSPKSLYVLINMGALSLPTLEVIL